jgi:hypothetical protein
MSKTSPGLEISALLGSYETFRDEMLAMIPRIVVDAGADAYSQPLARLDTGAPADPTVALVDAFAALADIVAFYQDRILNEGFLDTAVDYASLALLARSLGQGPGAHVGASVALALFAQPGHPVTVPAGSVIQGDPRKVPAGTQADPATGTTSATRASDTGPVFETAASVTADPRLNRLVPLQTRPAMLKPDATSLLLQGTGLRLVAGDFLILGLARPDDDPSAGEHLTQWVRLTVFTVQENSVLGTTLVEIGAPLQNQWTAGGASAPLPLVAAAGLRLFAVDLTSRLFGYNAPNWATQSYAVQRANTPPDHSPAEYDEWPGFGIDLNALDLQAIYPQVLPGSQFLLETPQDKKLGIIAAVSRQNLTKYGMTGQATEVALAPQVATQPSGNALVPARTGHSATVLDDGRVLIVGGVGQWGVLDSVEIFDPATGLVSQIGALPEPRALHSATTVGGIIYLAGGVLADFSLAVDLLRFDETTLTFSPVEVAPPPGPPIVPGIAFAALALPDDTLMLSGGLTGPAGMKFASLELLEASLAATDSVAVFSPQTNSWSWREALQRQRAGHSATLCPVVPRDGPPDSPSVGQVVIFLGGHDGGAISPPGAGSARLGSAAANVWADAELSDPVGWKPLPTIYPIESGDGSQGSARYDHVATSMPGNNGFLVTGGQSAHGPVADNWLIGALAASDGGQDGQDFAAVPIFTRGPVLAGPRSSHAAALLPGGRIVVAGGLAGATVLASTESFKVNPASSIPFEGASVLAASVPGSALPGAQACPAFAPLASGTLLLTGGLGSLPNGYLNSVVEFDPSIGTAIGFPGPVLSTPDTYVPVGTVALRDGTILVLGASTPGSFPVPPTVMNAYAWTFDPKTKLATTTGAPLTARIGSSVTLLSSGSVLLVGGMGMTETGYAALDTAEIYDPTTRLFRRLASKLEVPRYGHSATLLPDGTVLVAGGFYFPPILYDPPGIVATQVPALDSAELFNQGTQAFTSIASALPVGFGLHAATLLDNGDVLISGGASSFYTQQDFTTYEIEALAQAAVYTSASQGFAAIMPMPGPRALHSASLLPNGKVLIAGGVIDDAMTATDTTLLFDPRTSTFANDVRMSAPRRSHGAALVPDGVLMIGGVGEATTEVFVPGGKQAGASSPLPAPMPSPAWPPIVALTQQVVAIPFAGFGVFAFGGAVDGGSSTTIVIQYVEAPPPPGHQARRQALVYTQTRPLSLAPPIDDWPVGLIEPATPAGPLNSPLLVLSGLVYGLEAGKPLIITGNPPLAKAIGDLSSPDGSPGVESGCVIMVYAEVPATEGRAWQCQVADIGMLTLATDPGAEPPTTLEFLSGNGTTVGSITAADVRSYDRPVHSERVTVKSFVQDAATNTTIVTSTTPLRYLYDRTTTSVYGNVVNATQGSTVTNEVLGSGDGERAFQTFMLKQAPLTWLEDPGGTIVPQLHVMVGGNRWQQVAALYDQGPDDRVYQLAQDAQGRAQIQFGDGVHGLRLPTGQNNVSATYRVGAGFEGNVPAGSLTRAPAHLAGIASVLNPVAAAGGIGPPPRSLLRGRIPNGVRDLGRIVTQEDMLSFVLDRPEIGSAVLSTCSLDQVPVSLVSLAGPGNVIPDRDQVLSIEAAFAAALAAPLQYRLLPYVSVPFKLRGIFTIETGRDEQAVHEAIVDVVRAAYATSALTFGDRVRSSDITTLIQSVGGVAAVTLTDLWVPTREGPVLNDLLIAWPASLDPRRAAEILSISPDTDAVELFTPPSPEVGGLRT